MSKKRPVRKVKKNTKLRTTETIFRNQGNLGHTINKVHADELLIVPSHYIIKDLYKTILLSLIFIGVILGLFWYFNTYDFTVSDYLKL